MIEPQSELIQYPVRFLGSCEWRQGDETRRSPRRFTSFATARSLQRRDCGCSTAGCSWSIQEIQKGRWKRRVPFHKSQRVDGVGLKQGKKNRARHSKAGLVSTNQVYGEVCIISWSWFGRRKTWGNRLTTMAEYLGVWAPLSKWVIPPVIYNYIYIYGISRLYIYTYIYTVYMSSYIYIYTLLYIYYIYVHYIYMYYIYILYVYYIYTIYILYIYYIYIYYIYTIYIYYIYIYSIYTI